MLLNHKISAKAMFALLFYLIIPMVAISVILFSYEELSKERFVNMIYWIIPTSIVIVIISQVSIKYEKGDDKRFVLNLLYVFLTLVWIYGFIGGSPVLTQSWLEYEFSIHLWKYISLIIAAAMINIFYYTLEWRIYKKELTRNKNEMIQEDIESKLNTITIT